MTKPKCMLTVDVEALPIRAHSNHVETLIHGRVGEEEYGISRFMDIADKHGLKMTFFLDFAEVMQYGDAIIEAGKYIVSKGHDLQIHCHYDLLSEKVKVAFPNAESNYYTWYENEEISLFMLDYCIEQYNRCTDKPYTAYRGGEYRFGKAFLIALKERGFRADLSYNFERPEKKPITPPFVFENGIIELPITALPNVRPINFNTALLCPKTEDDFHKCISQYKSHFHDAVNFFGPDAILTFLMHSWSFLLDGERFKSSGYIDKPVPFMADFFDLMLGELKGVVDFITVEDGVKIAESQNLKTLSFDKVFSYKDVFANQMGETNKLIESKANGREIVIWGTGGFEKSLHHDTKPEDRLNVSFYVSRDARSLPLYRGKPVKLLKESELSPEKHYVVIVALAQFYEIRQQLKAKGFVAPDDYYDFDDRAEGRVSLEKALMERRYKNKDISLFTEREHQNLTFALSTNARGLKAIEYMESKGVSFTGAKILDIGCAYGGFTIEARRRGAEFVYGVDIDEFLLSFANVNIQDEPTEIREGCKFVLCDVTAEEALELPNNYFDIIIINDVFEHVYDTARLLHILNRLSTSAGSIYFAIPNGLHYFDYAEREPHSHIHGISFLDPYLWSYEAKLNVYYRRWEYYDALFRHFGFADIELFPEYHEFASKVDVVKNMQDKFASMNEKLIANSADKPTQLKNAQIRALGKFKDEMESDIIHMDMDELTFKYHTPFWKGLAKKVKP